MFFRPGLFLPGRFLGCLVSFRSSGAAERSRFLPAFVPPLRRSRRSERRLRPAGESRKDPKNHEESRKTKMPQKVKGHQAGAVGSSVKPLTSGPVTQDRSGAVSIVVYAKPGSKRSAVTDVTAEAVGVAIAAPPIDGEANSELLRFLAEVLQLKKNQVSLDKGCRSRDKLVRVDSPLSPEEVLKKLGEAAS